MITKHYINNYDIYRPSESISPSGVPIMSSSLYMSGKCRIEPQTDDEGISTHRMFIAKVDLDTDDVINIDGVPYQVKGIGNYFGHHLEVNLKYID